MWLSVKPNRASKLLIVVSVHKPIGKLVKDIDSSELKLLRPTSAVGLQHLDESK